MVWNPLPAFLTLLCWPLPCLLPVRLTAPLSPALAFYKGREGSLFCTRSSLELSWKIPEEWPKGVTSEYLKSLGDLESGFCLVGERLQACRATTREASGRHSSEDLPLLLLYPQPNPYMSHKPLSLNMNVHSAFASSMYLSNFPFYGGNFLI